MSVLWILAGAIIVIGILKVIFKTLKFVLVLSVFAIIAVIFYLLQHGILIPK